MLVNEDEYFRGQVEGDILYGVMGPPGPAGKSAYAYAKENGYTGSESDFSRLLGQFPERIDTAVQRSETAADAAYRAIDALGNTGISVVNTDSGEVISLTDSAERPLMGMKVYGKTTQNGTPTPDEPIALDSVGADGRVDVTVFGKNLLPNTAKTVTQNGVTFTVNDDGSVTMNGTALYTVSAFCTINNSTLRLTEGVRYTLSGCPKHTGVAMFAGNYGNDSGNGYTFTAYTTASSGLSPQIYIRVSSGTTVNNVVVKPMLRLASITDTTYEPCKEQTLSISTPNGLPGIPVSSGGNYTDETGQQWICDEVDFEKGVYVQRVVLAKLTSTMNWKYSSSTNRFYTVISNAKADYSYRQFIGLCSHYTAGVQDKNVAISYINEGNEGVAIRDESRFSGDMNVFKSWLDTNDVWVCTLANRPIETALSAEQLAAFAALHTNYPNTTVFNDKNAGMEVKYVADTKLYIDKKFDQLAAAMLNN